MAKGMESLKYYHQALVSEVLQNGPIIWLSKRRCITRERQLHDLMKGAEKVYYEREREREREIEREVGGRRKKKTGGNIDKKEI